MCSSDLALATTPQPVHRSTAVRPSILPICSSTSIRRCESCCGAYTPGAATMCTRSENTSWSRVPSLQFRYVPRPQHRALLVAFDRVAGQHRREYSRLDGPVMPEGAPVNIGRSRPVGSSGPWSRVRGCRPNFTIGRRPIPAAGSMICSTSGVTRPRQPARQRRPCRSSWAGAQPPLPMVIGALLTSCDQAATTATRTDSADAKKAA